MKKILVAGGSHSEMPVIQSAKDLGYYVITTGSDAGAPGHKIADKYIEGDYSDKQFVFELAQKEEVEGIVSGANDFSYISVAYACEKLGLKGHDNYENARRVHIKNEFREALRKIEVRTPSVWKCFNEEDADRILKEINLPVVVKPVDLTGGKGVKVCYSEEEVAKSIRDAKILTREDYVIVEEFIEGSPHGFSSFIKDGKVIWHLVDNEQYGENKYLVLGASSPSDIPQSAEFTLIKDIEKFANKYDLEDGLFHVQFILSNDGYPVMIDPCRRMPGDLYILLSKYTTGVDVPAEILKYELGINDKNEYFYEHNFIARECIMGAEEGIVKDVFIDDRVKDKIIYSYFRDYKGEVVEDSLKYKAGILIMKFDSYREMNDILTDFDRLVKIEME